MGSEMELGPGKALKVSNLFCHPDNCRDTLPSWSYGKEMCSFIPRGMPFLHCVPRMHDEYSRSISMSCPGTIPLALVFKANCFHLLLLYVPLYLSCFPFPHCLAASFFLCFLDSRFFVQKAPKKSKRGEKMHIASH